MAEASKTTGKPMTTASFIEQLNQTKTDPPAAEPVEASETVSSKPTVLNESSNSMEGLSDSDLQTLLQNFKDLSTEEQHGLITYLKKLEAKEPERVERLRKFVNLGSEKAEKDKRPTSPFSARLGSVNPTVDDRFSDAQFVDDEKEDEDGDHPKKEENKSEKDVGKINIDSDEEDYTFEDVFHAANQKVKEKEMEKEKERQLDVPKIDSKINLSDAKALIANIMGAINAKDNNLLGMKNPNSNTNSSGNTPQYEHSSTSGITAGSIAHAMDQISAENVKNLENIVGNMQSTLKSPAEINKSGSSAKTLASSFPPSTTSNFRTNFNLNLLGNESMPPKSNIDNSRLLMGNLLNPNTQVNPINNTPFGQSVRPEAPNLNRGPAMQQNVQYPMKNIYGGYGQNPPYSNQGNFNRGAPPPFANQNFGYDNRYGFNNRGGRQGGNNNYGGNRW